MSAASDKARALAAAMAAKKPSPSPKPMSPVEKGTAHKVPGKDPYKMYKSPGVNGFKMNLPKG